MAEVAFARAGRSGRRTLLAQNLVPVEPVVDELQDKLDYEAKLRPMQAQSNRTQETLRVRQRPWVFVLSKDGRLARRRRINIGRRSAEQVEVRVASRPGGASSSQTILARNAPTGWIFGSTWAPGP